MKTFSTLLQIATLAACFVATADGELRMPGMRRAMQTMSGQTVQMVAVERADVADGIGD